MSESTDQFMAGFTTCATGEAGRGVPRKIDLAAKRRRLDVVLHKLAKRKAEALTLYVALPRAVAFHESRAHTRILDASNQSGKTLAAAIESARCWCNLDVEYRKYPARGSAIVVGFDEKHTANPMWKTLAEPGAFDVIRDEHTGVRRAVRLNPDNPLELDPYDEAYRERWTEAPPIIPPRMIKTLVWKDAGLRAPAHVTTTAGWSIEFRTSKTDPKRGSQIDYWWFDEEIRNSLHLPEAYRGCMRRGGIGVWSATAQSGGVQLFQLYLKAESGDPLVKRFPLYVAENAYFNKEDRQVFYDSLSPEEREVRWYGIYHILGQRVYGAYEPQGIHGCESFSISPDWTVEVTVDPAGQRLGTIFGAIDPEEAHAWVYDGFAMRQADARRWAEEVKKRLLGRRPYRYIIDQRMGKQRTVGQALGTNVAKTYFAALVEAGITPVVQGVLNGFFPGSDDVLGREAVVKDWLAIRGSGPHEGTPKLQVFRGCIPELDDEMRMAKRDGDRPEKRAQMVEDVLVSLEYWAASDPHYHRAQRTTVSGDPDMRARLEAKRARIEQRGPRRKSTVLPGLTIY